jgi:hypothetical protein
LEQFRLEDIFELAATAARARFERTKKGWKSPR